MIVNYPAGGPTDIEGRIVAQHLPAHIPGNPTDRGEERRRRRRPDRQQPARRDRQARRRDDRLLHPGRAWPSSSAIRRCARTIADFVLIAGRREPAGGLHARKDTPPGLNVAADMMKAKDFKALSLNAQNTNTHQPVARARPARHQVPCGAGLSRPEGSRDRDPAEHRAAGQLLALGLERLGRADDGRHVVMPLWQLSPRGKDGSYPRSKALPNLQTFEEFYASVQPRQAARRAFRLPGAARGRATRSSRCSAPP